MAAETTIKYTGALVVVSCWCGIRLGIPDSLYYEMRRHGQARNCHCPLGHKFVFSGETEAERERRYRKEAEARAQAIEDQLAAEKRSHAATKGAHTKTRRRIAAGVCPCCNRSFEDLHRHMQTKHPGFAE